MAAREERLRTSSIHRKPGVVAPNFGPTATTRSASPGAYFVRLEAEGQALRRVVTMLR